MKPVNDIINYGNDLFLDTGSPHYVQLVSDIENIDVFSQGRLIRNNSIFKNNGVNVNFVQVISKSEFSVRTYERGVENETLSCGTGVTAVALAMFELNKTSLNKIKMKTILTC